MKEQYRETDIVRNITSIQFSIFTNEEIQQLSHIPITCSTIYEGSNGREQSNYGVLDKKLGVSQKDSTCATCRKSLAECVGHFGHIDLPRPIFHVGFLAKILKILQNICKSCANILLKPEEKKILLATRMKSESFSFKREFFKKTLNDKCKKVSICPHCGEVNGKLKKLYLQIAHEKFASVKKDDRRLSEYLELLDTAKENNKDLVNSLPALPIEFLEPAQVLDLFKRIPLEDVKLLCMNPEFGHPKDLLMTKVPVAPACIRPSVVSEIKAGTTEDDITMSYNELVFTINGMLDQTTRSLDIMASFSTTLQYITSSLINSDVKLPPQYEKNLKPKRGFVQRLKGKHGRFRGNLSGKRVDFSSRTVISPDPNLRINEVGVPVEVAKLLTYPELVTKHNIKLMSQLIKNGPKVHPGAVYYTARNQKTRKSVGHIDRHSYASQLKCGDLIERHLMDGDIVLFNRQPSLHKMSIMSHQAKVLPGRTFRFNECVCTPYNADFDGDEMNLHLPQTEEARAEAYVLMGVKSNLVTPRSGTLIIGATQDFITSTYLLTQKDEFFDRQETCMLICTILGGKDIYHKIDLPKPAILKPKELWTGKQIFSVLLRPNRAFPVKCNLVTRRKNYSKSKGEDALCLNECCVVIRNSELLSGAIDKGLIGSGNKKNVFYTIMKDYGKDYAADAMWKIARISSYYLTNRGFSIGIGDVRPGKKLLKRKGELLDSGYNNCNQLLLQLDEGTLTCNPGCSPEETLEHLILKELSTIRKTSGDVCESELNKMNAALIMALSGSKGSFINISQMIACVGQQAISGKRVPNGFEDRALPHFLKGKMSRKPEAKGFVDNSFFSGLTPTEFIFHTMAGREGLVDTAVKTADTGYMQRRLVKSLEDLYIGYDRTVRNSSQDVVQFSFGTDGFDPTEMECDIDATDFDRLLTHVKASNSDGESKDVLSKNDIKIYGRAYLNEKVFRDLDEQFKEKALNFLVNYGEIIDKTKTRFGVDHIERLTLDQMMQFFQISADRHRAAVMEPGTAVGALCAQSIGEPGTQMTLKTFHFAGVAAMNITQGVPRIKEIINASRHISTPIITAKLTCNTDLEKARQVKGRIEKTLLGEVCEYIEEVFLPDDCFLLLKLAMDRIRLLKLEVDANSIQYNIMTSKKLKAKEAEVEVKSDTIILVRPKAKSSTMYYMMQHFKQHIKDVVIKGLPSINRAIIHKNDSAGVETYELAVEGNDLREVIGTYGVEGIKCTSNNTLEVFETLGIEAARATIIKEITMTMTNHGLSVDHRHIWLLADFMTCRGQVRGITRYGLEKTKESVLMLASYEKTGEHLFDAAYHGQNNPINGVSDCIILGKPINIGTGLFKLLHKHDRKPPSRSRDLIFDQPQLHMPRSFL